ncbi:hypothetical protein FQN52_007108 [Onygenales sp. PD_12]|nr:hypothetical protein FQN52_007108 [Onygenales sp. PD_12]
MSKVASRRVVARQLHFPVPIGSPTSNFTINIIASRNNNLLTHTPESLASAPYLPLSHHKIQLFKIAHPNIPLSACFAQSRQGPLPAAMDPQPASTASLSKRRRFQVPITNYFSAGDSTSTSHDTSSHHNYSAPTFSPVPAIPHGVQSSLLAVGMRVRKSVPEGYKTTTPKPSPYAYRSHVSATVTSNTTATSHTHTTTYAGLAPFCGVLKTGNLAVQVFPQQAEQMIHNNHSLDEEWDKGSIPASSQDSVDSYTYTIPPSNPNKRSFDLDDAADSDSDDLEEYSSIFPHGFNTMWKSTIPVPAPVAAATRSSRHILSPRLGQKTVKNRQQKVGGGYGQENFDPIFISEPTSGGDFEEAAFLRRREEVEGEVEMGGV